MDNDSPQIEEKPSRISSTLNMIRNGALMFQCFTNLLPDSFNLAGAVPTAYNEIIGKGANLSYVQHNDIISLFV